MNTNGEQNTQEMTHMPPRPVSRSSVWARIPFLTLKTRAEVKPGPQKVLPEVTGKAKGGLSPSTPGAICISVLELTENAVRSPRPGIPGVPASAF